MDGISLPQPSTHPLARVLRDKQSPVTRLCRVSPSTTVLSPERAPLLCESVSLFRSVWTLVKLTWVIKSWLANLTLWGL